MFYGITVILLWTSWHWVFYLWPEFLETCCWWRISVFITKKHVSSLHHRRKLENVTWILTLESEMTLHWRRCEAPGQSTSSSCWERKAFTFAYRDNLPGCRMEASGSLPLPDSSWRDLQQSYRRAPMSSERNTSVRMLLIWQGGAQLFWAHGQCPLWEESQLRHGKWGASWWNRFLGKFPYHRKPL